MPRVRSSISVPRCNRPTRAPLQTVLIVSRASRLATTEPPPPRPIRGVSLSIFIHWGERIDSQLSTRTDAVDASLLTAAYRANQRTVSSISNDEHNNAWRQGRFQYNRSVTVAIWIKLDHRASDESWWKTACWLVGGKSKTQSCDETNSATNWSGHANRFDWRNRAEVEFVQRKV